MTAPLTRAIETRKSMAHNGAMARNDRAPLPPLPPSYGGREVNGATTTALHNGHTGQWRKSEVYRMKPRHGTKPIPAKTRAVLADAQTRMTIRMLLANGAVRTTIGPICILRVPGSQLSQQFSAALVDEVERDASRWASERRLMPSEENSDVG